MKHQKIIKKIVIFFIFLPFLVYAEELLDLEKNTQDFVLETKQIIIPDFPGAFNASIVRWDDKLLMCFRVRNADSISTFEFGLVWLDTNFNPITKAQILEIHNNSSTHAKNQDARLIVIDQKLYIIYSNFITFEELTSRRMFIAELEQKTESGEEKFFINNPVCLHPFEEPRQRWEKNWVPFNYNNSLLVAYSLAPHHILRPSLDTGSCSIESTAYSLINWEWGELRGGSPALLDGDKYIAFFHSSTYLSSLQSDGKKMQHYFMGAYTFSAKPPFEITSISPEPIIGKNFYNGPAYSTWKPLRVVFPMGCIIDEDYFWVTYGRQDFEIWVAKIDKKKLYASLVPTPQTDQKKLDCFCQNYISHSLLNNAIANPIDCEANGVTL